jgi:hypothetical protein
VAAELCTLTPVASERVEALAAVLAALPGGDESPLARVPGTHFARWVVAPWLRGRDGATPVADSACLVFAAEFDHAEPEDYLRALREHLPDEVHRVWGHCRGYPGAPDARLGGWLLAHRVRPGFSVRAFPDAEVGELRAAAELRARLGEFALEARQLPPEALKRAWQERFGREAG